MSKPYVPHPVVCVKCGSDRGWRGPRYRFTKIGPLVTDVTDEQLVFTCDCCGYERRKPTVDASPRTGSIRDRD